MDLEKTLTLSTLLDTSLKVGMVPDAKFHYKWHEYSKWQLQSLIGLGLQKDHKLLDIGCGPLRFGLEAINFLNDDCYFGIDPYPPFIKLGKLFYNNCGLNKHYRVVENEQFDFNTFETKFDVANAQSVFTHLSRKQVKTALNNLKGVMNKGGFLLFTNIESEIARGFLYGSRYPMFQGTGMDQDFYQNICDSLEISLEYDVLNHPTQKAHLIRF